jgi:hypothetical protein
MKRLILVGCIAVLPGCVGLMGESVGTRDRGRILISADREGMRAFGDLMTGAINVGKASPDQDTAHHELRRKQTLMDGMKNLGTDGLANSVGGTYANK